MRFLQGVMCRLFTRSSNVFLSRSENTQIVRVTVKKKWFLARFERKKKKIWRKPTFSPRPFFKKKIKLAVFYLRFHRSSKRLDSRRSFRPRTAAQPPRHPKQEEVPLGPALGPLGLSSHQDEDPPLGGPWCVWGVGGSLLAWSVCTATSSGTWWDNRRGQSPIRRRAKPREPEK